MYDRTTKSTVGWTFSCSWALSSWDRCTRPLGWSRRFSSLLLGTRPGFLMSAPVSLAVLGLGLNGDFFIDRRALIVTRFRFLVGFV